MGTTPSSPDKSELSQQLWDIVTTLTPEAQNACLRKAEELGFDLNRIFRTFGAASNKTLRTNLCQSTT
jgi:hypothetical protein